MHNNTISTCIDLLVRHQKVYNFGLLNILRIFYLRLFLLYNFDLVANFLYHCFSRNPGQEDRIEKNLNYQAASTTTYGLLLEGCTAKNSLLRPIATHKS